MTCRGGSSSAPTDEQVGLLASASAGDLESGREKLQRPKPVSRLGLCLCALAMLLLLMLSFLPQGPPRKSSTPAENQTLSAILYKASQRALGGGLGGAVAGVCQVLTLMWLRTAMNYQYRHGGSLRTTLRTLHAQGGVRRFYQGLPYALLQTPLSRFGDTATNVGVLALFGALLPETPLGVRTACASGTGSLWRMAITPLDTFKTSLQVEGAAGYQLILRKARTDGIGTLWNGALGNAAASFVGSYPWFLTFNALDEMLPRPDRSELARRLLRSATMGCLATGVSDVASNSIRVVKTTRQTSEVQMSYMQAIEHIVATDGWAGLLCRGLGTRLLANAIQSALFAVVWKFIEAEINGK